MRSNSTISGNDCDNEIGGGGGGGDDATTEATEDVTEGEC